MYSLPVAIISVSQTAANNMNAVLLLCLVSLPAAFARRTPFVVGGTEAAEGAWPWQLSLKYLGDHSCGASLIGSKWAVCAAHCIGNALVSYEIQAGTNKRTCSDGWCQTAKPNGMTRHPDYVGAGSAGYPNDVSVITWPNTIAEVAGKIEYVTMATTADQVGQECYISGWGRTSGSSPLPENLMQALVDLLTTEECAALWGSTPVTDNHVCVYDKTTQARGACNGDSGGPLVCRATSADPWILVGATSWGRTGCDTAYPSVYTRISSYEPWIQTQAP